MATTQQQIPAPVAPAPAAAPPATPKTAAKQPERVRIAVGSALVIGVLVFANGSTFALKGLRQQFGNTGGWVAYAVLVAVVIAIVILVARWRIGKLLGRGRGRGGSGGSGLGGGPAGRGSGSGLGRLFNPKSWGRNRGGAGKGSGAGAGGAGGPARKPGLLSRLRNALPKGFPGSTKGKQPKVGAGAPGSGSGGGTSKAGRGTPGSGRGTGRGKGRNGTADPADGKKNRKGFTGGFMDKIDEWRSKKAKEREKAAKDAKKQADQDAKTAKDPAAGQNGKADPQADKPNTSHGRGDGRPSPSPRPTAGGTSTPEGRSRPVAAAAANSDAFGNPDDSYSFVAWLLKFTPIAARSVVPRRARINRIAAEARDVYRVPAPLQDELDEIAKMMKHFEEMTGEMPTMAKVLGQHRDYLDPYDKPAGGSIAAQATRDVTAYREGGGS